MKDVSSSVLMITGPAGSGKSALGEYAAKELGWRYVSEDEYWVKAGWSGHRTDEQEAQIQQQVTDDVLGLLASSQGVVLEFILYKDPPNPFMVYTKILDDNLIPYRAMALKPSLGVIMQRIKKRGREHDLANLDEVKTNAQNQLNCLEAEYIQPYVVDTTGMTVAQTLSAIDPC